MEALHLNAMQWRLVTLAMIPIVVQAIALLFTGDHPNKYVLAVLYVVFVFVETFVYYKLSV